VPEIAPALVLSALVGVGWTAFFVVVRGTAGARLPLVALVAAIGAWAGDAIGGRLGLDPLVVGDFHLLAASVGAWAGIAFVILVSILGPTRRT
jgi:hypothetical protein